MICFNCGCKIGEFKDYWANIEGLNFCSASCRREHNKEKLNKKNINNWFIKIKKVIIKDIRGHKIKNIGKIIILNIKEIN